MKRILSLLTICMALSTMAVAQTELTTYRPGITPEGAVYYLPKTAINISVLIEKTTTTPGEFCKYAQRYLRLNNVAQSSSTSYRVVGINQWASAQADTTKAFAVKFNPKTVAANLSLSNDGRLLAINAEPHKVVEPESYKAAPKAQRINPRQYMSEEILAAGSTAKMAELTAAEIYDLRENRNLLIKGQADFMPNDGQQMRMMLARMELQETAMTELFTGFVDRDTTEHILTVCPDAPIEDQVLFRLSQRMGLVDADDLSGTPYYINIEDLKAIPMPVENPSAKKHKQPESGIYVNMPGKMRVSILHGKEQLSVAEHTAPQFGYTELLSGELFNKHYSTRLWLNPVSGALERLDAEQPK